jgi:hypothetical protein
MSLRGRADCNIGEDITKEQFEVRQFDRKININR